VIEAALVPLVEALIALWRSQGKDPEVELRAMLDAADVATDAAERAKFGSGGTP